jgi:hypothetical protein
VGYACDLDLGLRWRREGELQGGVCGWERGWAEQEQGVVSSSPAGHMFFSSDRRVRTTAASCFSAHVSFVSLEVQRMLNPSKRPRFVSSRS